MQPSQGGQRHRAGAYARVHASDGAVSTHDPECVGRSGRAPGGADGQLRGRAHEHGCRAGGVPGPDTNRQIHRRRRVLREPGADLGDGAMRPRRALAAPRRSRVGRRCPQPSPAPRCPGGDGAAERCDESVRTRHHRRPRHVTNRRSRLRGGARTNALGGGPWADRQHRRALLRDGSGSSLEPHEAGVRRHGPRDRKGHHLSAARGCKSPMRPAPPTSSSSPLSSRGTARHSDRSGARTR